MSVIHIHKSFLVELDPIAERRDGVADLFRAGGVTEHEVLVTTASQPPTLGHAARMVIQIRADRVARTSQARLAAPAAASGRAASLLGLAAAWMVSTASIATSAAAALPATTASRTRRAG